MLDPGCGDLPDRLFKANLSGRDSSEKPPEDGLGWLDVRVPEGIERQFVVTIVSLELRRSTFSIYLKLEQTCVGSVCGQALARRVA